MAGGAGRLAGGTGTGFGRQFAGGAASAIAGAATRALATGTSFGDNVLAVLPEVAGATIGQMVARGIAGSGRATVPQLSADVRALLGDATVTGGDPDRLTFVLPMGLPMGGNPMMMSAGAGSNVDIPIRQSNPVPRDLAEARQQYAETLAQIDRYKASLQAKQDARAEVDAIYAPYLDPDHYGGVAAQLPSVDLGPVSLTISAFGDAAYAPGAEHLSRIAEGLGSYVELFPKTRINEAATLVGIMAGEAIGGLYKPADVERMGESAPLTSGPRLLPTEGNVGTYRDLVKAGSPGDNITPNHIPSANRMAQEGVSKGDGIAINMEPPVPGVGGRHRATFTYGNRTDANMTARDALAAGVWDARGIYRADGLYGPQIRGNLQDLIRMNKIQHPTIFRAVSDQVVSPARR